MKINRDHLAVVAGLAVAAVGLIWVFQPPGPRADRGVSGEVEPPRMQQAASADPTIVTGAATRGDHRWEVIVGVKNSAARSGYRLVGLKCTWFRGGSPVEVSGSVATNVVYGTTSHEKLYGPRAEISVDSVDCRSSYAYPN